MSATVPVPSPQRRAADELGPGRTLELAFGALGLLAAVAFVVAGTALTWALETQRDGDGHFTSAVHHFETTTYALEGDLDIGTQWPDRAFGYGFDSVRIEASGAGAMKPLFIGVARTEDVEAYLAGVEHDEISAFDADPFAVEYRRTPGDAVPVPPTAQNFWQARALGPGRVTIVWPVEEGEWSVVAMNADGSPSIGIDAQLAARAPSLWWLVTGLFVIGGLSLLGGGALVYLGARMRVPHMKEALQ